jgi:hypothetical protein
LLMHHENGWQIMQVLSTLPRDAYRAHAKTWSMKSNSPKYELDLPVTLCNKILYLHLPKISAYYSAGSKQKPTGKMMQLFFRSTCCHFITHRQVVMFSCSQCTPGGRPNQVLRNTLTQPSLANLCATS